MILAKVNTGIETDQKWYICEFWMANRHFWKLLFIIFRAKETDKLRFMKWCHLNFPKYWHFSLPLLPQLCLANYPKSSLLLLSKGSYFLVCWNSSTQLLANYLHIVFTNRDLMKKIEKTLKKSPPPPCWDDIVCRLPLTMM